MAEQDARTLVGYKVDQGSVASAVAANIKITHTYEDMAVAAKSVGLTVEQLAARTGITVVGTNQQITQSNSQVADSYKRVAAEAGKAAQSQGGGFLGGARQVAGSAGGVLSLVGGSQAASAASSVLGLTSALGPLGAALGVAVVATSALSRAQEEAAASAKRYLDAVQEGATLTTEEAENQIQALTTQKNALEAAQNILETYRAQFDEYARQSASIVNNPDIAVQEAFQAQFAATFQQLSEATKGAVYNAATLSAALTEGSSDIETLSGKIGFLQLAIDNGSTAVNDATEANKAFADSLKDGVTKALEDVAKAAEDVEKRFSDARSKQYDAMLEAMDIEAKLRTEITDTLTKIGEIQAERDAKLLELADDNKERRIEIEADARDRIAQIVQASADNIARIMRDAGREQFTAVAQRDALAHYQSKIRQGDALDDQKKADQRAVEQTARTMEKQLQLQQKAFDKQVQNTTSSYGKQLATQQSALTQMNVDFANASAARMNIESNLNSSLYGMQVAHMNAMIGVVYQGGLDMVSALKSAFQQGLSAGGGGIGGAVGGIPGLGGQATFNRMFDNRYAQMRQAVRGG